jgi:hypothetical protein
MSASTCSVPTGSQLDDSRLYLYGGSCSSLVCLGADDEECHPGASLSWNSALGDVYHIQVTGTNSFNAGPFLLRVDGTGTVVQSQSTYSSMFLNLACVTCRDCFALKH